MKSYRFSHFGSLDHLTVREEPMPQVGRGEVLVRVRASALNFRDIAMVQGKYPMAYEAGLVPMSDAAGEIMALGDGVTGFVLGQRVINSFHPRWFGGRMPVTRLADLYGSNQDGWLVEYKAVSQEALVAAPANLSFEELATLPCAALTAWTALAGPEPIRAGQTILTLGSGAVSLFALQLGKAFGATVIATTSSSDRMERLKLLGADEVINYIETPHWGEAVHAMTNGRGVDRVVEVGGAGTLAQSMRAVAQGGEIALIGFLAADSSNIPLASLLGCGADFRMVRVGDRSGLTKLVQTVSQVGLKPVIDRVFPFDRAVEAWRYAGSGPRFGKVVISI